MKCLLVLFAVATFFATGEAIRCYECQGQPACNDPFDKLGAAVITYRLGCVCAKEVIEYASDIFHTTRTCVLPNYSSSKSADVRGTSIKSYTLSLCMDDLCNAANTVITTQIILIALAVLLTFTN